MKRSILVLALFTACNKPPTSPVIAIEPAEPRSIDDLELVFEVESFDQNVKDTVRYDIRWFRNDTEVEDKRGERTIPWGSTFQGQTWRVEVVPTDGLLPGAKATAEVSIRNSPPEIDSVHLSPASVGTQGVLEVSYSATDMDDDLLEATISWEVNGQELTAHQRKLNGFDFFDKNDEVQAFIVVNDGYDDSPRVGSQVVVVDNTPPTTPEIALSTEEPRPGQALVCEIVTESTDLDDDTVNYLFTWTKNGGSASADSTTNYPGDTVSGAQLKTDDEWTCHVKANDGQGTSVEVTATAVVGAGTVPGFKGEEGPEFKNWLQCEGYLDKPGGDNVPAAWGNDCTGSQYKKIRLVCGASKSSFRYIEVSKNVFRDGLNAYPESGLITAFRDAAGTDITLPSNVIYASGNHPHTGSSWWVSGNGCGETTPSLTVNNSCSWEASNCLGQGLSGDRYLWVYVSE